MRCETTVAAVAIFLSGCVGSSGSNAALPNSNFGGGTIADAAGDDDGSTDQDGKQGAADTSKPLVCNNECCTTSNKYGKCTRPPEGGKCIAGCDANCVTATFRCLSEGACTAVEGECVVRGDSDCKKSESCKKFGYCLEGFHGAGCTPLQSATKFCKNRDVCKKHGACKPGNGNCVDPQDPTNCKKSYACKAEGRCSWNPKRKRCTALTLADCEGQWCGQHCAIKGGICKLAETDAACQSQEACAYRGRCHSKDGKCVPLSAADCEQATQCKKHGRCSYKEFKKGSKTQHVCCDKDGNGCQ